MRQTPFLCFAFLVACGFAGVQTTRAQANDCANFNDLRGWKVVILSNYQSPKPEDKKLAIDAGKKYVEKEARCKINDDFSPWLVKRIPDWSKSIGETATTFAATPAVTGSKYDAELASKLGADERGMKNYVMCILKTGPKDAEIQGKTRDDIFAGHFANISNLAEQGKLAVAGPFGKNDRTYRGLYIFNVPTIEEAEKLVFLDPAVKAGIFVPELTLWYGSASLMATPEIHKKLEKPKSN